MSSSKVVPILSTAGAVPVRNEKGKISMQKVKENRYVSGKRSDYGIHLSSEGSEDEEFIRPRRGKYSTDQQPDERFHFSIKWGSLTNIIIRELE